jgi:hypothetical protein
MFWSSPFWDVTQRMLVFAYGRFGTAYRSHLQGSSTPRRIPVWLCRTGPARIIAVRQKARADFLRPQCHCFILPTNKRTALFKIYALYAYIRLSEPFCRALTVTVKYTYHESAKIQAHEFWIILPYGFILRQKLRETRRGVSVWQL